jgi:hypothetical protein
MSSEVGIKRPPIIHVHIPKAAGTTLNELLGRAIGGVHFAYSLPGKREALEAMPQTERDRIDFLFGHFPYGLHTLFSRSASYIACVREPRRRLFSFYHYLLATEDHPKHAFVKEKAQDFASFLLLARNEQRLREEVDNVQVRMIAGAMQLRMEYDEVVAAALSNISAKNFFVSDVERMKDFLPFLEKSLQLEFGPMPRLNASRSDTRFEDEMAQLVPEAHEVLARFTKWDWPLYTAARDSHFNAPLPALGKASPPADSQSPPHNTSIFSEADVLRRVTAALYRVLLFREPDVVGLATYVQQMLEGRPIEDVVQQILSSKEFDRRREQFSLAYMSPPPHRASVDSYEARETTID